MKRRISEDAGQGRTFARKWRPGERGPGRLPDRFDAPRPPPTLHIAAMSALAALGAGAATVALAGEPMDARGLAAGWAVAVAQGLAALWIDGRAIGAGTARFLLWGLGANSLRIAMVAGSIFAFRQPGVGRSYVISLVAGFLTFMVGEVLVLHFRSLASGRGSGSREA